MIVPSSRDGDARLFHVAADMRVEPLPPPVLGTTKRNRKAYLFPVALGHVQLSADCKLLVDRWPIYFVDLFKQDQEPHGAAERRFSGRVACRLSGPHC